MPFRLILMTTDRPNSFGAPVGEGRVTVAGDEAQVVSPQSLARSPRKEDRSNQGEQKHWRNPLFAWYYVQNMNARHEQKAITHGEAALQGVKRHAVVR